MSWYDQAIAGWYRSKIASADAVAQGISQLGSSIGKAIEESRQNSIANQIGSQEANSGAYAPRAGLVSPGTNPDTGEANQIDQGVPTQGTAPKKFTGGYMGLQLQNAIDSLRMRNQNYQSEQALREAQGKYYNAHTDVIQQNAGIAQQRANTYQQSVDNKANGPQMTIQVFTKQAQDLLGKEKAQGWINVISGGQPFSRGDVDQDGNWKSSATGSMYSYGSSPDELASNAAPVQDVETLDQQYAKVGAGTGQRQGAPQGQHGATTPGGQPLATTTPMSPQQARDAVRQGTLKPGDWFPGTDGNHYQVPP